MIMNIPDKDNILRITAPAKINLHLEILGLRDDGFHELAMLMQSIGLSDQLEIKKRNDNKVILTTDDINLTTNEDNLIIKAARILKSKANCFALGADIYLRKKIPIGAGLAGGSSDGAAALLGLNNIWRLNFSLMELQDLAAELGSDMPFCLKGGSQLCFGRGEKLEELHLENSAMGVLLIKDPLVSVSTPWAYKRYKEINEAKYMNSESDFERRRKILRDENFLENSELKNSFLIRNDLQKIVETEVKAVEKSLKALTNLPGHLAVSMSGSGPSCFALYSNYNEAKEVFDKYRKSLQELGLEVWCCPFRSNGVLEEI